VTYEQGVADERARVIALFDEYEITELRGGVIMLEPRREVVDRSWKGVQHETGSLSSYWRGKCRCDACRAVASAYNKERRAIRKAEQVQPGLVPVISTPSPQEIWDARTPRGGWTRATLAGWGVPWPAPKGWKAELEQRHAELTDFRGSKPLGQRREVTFK
jgi:hypothetical protein